MLSPTPITREKICVRDFGVALVLHGNVRGTHVIFIDSSIDKRRRGRIVRRCRRRLPQQEVDVEAMRTWFRNEGVSHA